MNDWIARCADPVSTFSRYCAPTVVAAVYGVPKTEAAEMMLAVPGLPSRRYTGAVDTYAWKRFIEDEMGGVAVGREAIRNCHPKYREQGRGPWPTVSMFRERFPEGTYVVTTTAHTLLVQDGEVLADSMPTNSSRARVRYVYRLPVRAPGLVGEDASRQETRRGAWKGTTQQRQRRRDEWKRANDLTDGLNRFFRIT